jgi:hypothetical protein
MSRNGQIATAGCNGQAFFYSCKIGDFKIVKHVYM